MRDRLSLAGAPSPEHDALTRTQRSESLQAFGIPAKRTAAIARATVAGNEAISTARRLSIQADDRAIDSARVNLASFEAGLQRELDLLAAGDVEGAVSVERSKVGPSLGRTA